MGLSFALRNGSANPFSACQSCLPPRLVGMGTESRAGRQAPEGGFMGTVQPLTAHLSSRCFQVDVLLQLQSQHLLRLELGRGPAGYILPHPCPSRSPVSVGSTGKTSESQDGGPL